ncbi:MAG: GH25 family lysozyme [Myxococcota bacterium]
MGRRVMGMVLGGLAPAAVAACDEQGGAPVASVTVASTANVCASGPTLVGIDVSKWQGVIDWSAVASDAQDIRFAFIRVSDGINTPDVKFVANWAGAKENGLLRGAYQFFRPGQDAAAEADLLIDALVDDPGELPAVIDVENNSGLPKAQVAAQVGVWLERVEAATGRTPIIYTGASFWEPNVGSSAYAGYPLWVAHWTSHCPTIPSAWSDWTFWQNSATGSVDGIDGDVDMDQFDGSIEALAAMGETVVDPGPDPSPEVSPEVAEPAPDSAPEVAPETAPEVAPETAPEAAPEVGPEASPEVGPEATAEGGDDASAVALPPSRSTASFTHVDDGCAGAGDSAGFASWLAGALLALGLTRAWAAKGARSRG